MRYILAGLAILAAVTFSALFWLRSDTPSRLALTQRAGEISQGSLFGVHVGDSWQQADVALRARFRPSSVIWQTGRLVDEGGAGVRYSRTPILVGDAEVSYGDAGWRNGAVVLHVRDGRVTSIEWYYRGLFCCVDF